MSVIHLAKLVNSSEFHLHQDVIDVAYYQNIVSNDEIWEHVLKKSLLLVTST